MEQTACRCYSSHPSRGMNLTYLALRGTQAVQELVDAVDTAHAARIIQHDLRHALAKPAVSCDAHGCMYKCMVVAARIKPSRN